MNHELPTINYIRAFIAINIEEEIKEGLCQLISKLRNDEDQIKWVKRESFHLTLKFLGNINISQIEDIYKQLQIIASNNLPFKISLSSLGVFPNEKRPQVIWVGIEEGSKELIKIAQEVEDALEEMDISKERKKYTPHLTIGRIKRIKKREEFIKRIKNVNILKSNCFTAKKLNLMKSNLTPKGAIYATVKEIFFKNIDIS